jgi:hypothetical protein
MRASASISALLASGSTGSLRILDRAAHLVRGDARALYALVLPASGGLALVGLVLYYVERVLGITSLRPAFAVAAAALLALRALAAGAVARHVALLADGGAVASDLAAARAALTGRRVQLARVGVLSALLDLPAIFLCAWMTELGPLGAVFLVPVTGLRWIGTSPTWAARVAVTGDGVGRAWLSAWRDGSGGRSKAVVVETLLGLVALLVFLNGYVALVFGTLIGGTLLGLDLGFAASFLSPSNGFALTFLVVTALVIVEPLRMVASGLLWVDARVRHDALDLRRRVDALTAEDEPRPAPRSAAVVAAAILLALGVGMPAPALAQDGSPSELAPVVELAELPDRPPSAGDADRRSAARLLAAPEFAPVPEPGEGQFGDWLREVIRDLFELLMPDPDLLPDFGFDFALPGMKTFLVVAFVILVGAIAFTVWALRASRRRGEGPAPAEGARAVDVRERDPVDILAEAAALRRAGELRAALRTVYLATLVQLDRQRDIVFDPARTNWHYLRDFPVGERRDHFATLTRLFDHKWYGHEPVSDDDVGTAEGAARAILALTGRDGDVAKVA